MNNELYNDSTEFSKHPLKNLLIDCIAAATGGSTSRKLIEATKLSGWDHYFVATVGYKSVEKIVWDNSSVYNKLVKIYS